MPRVQVGYDPRAEALQTTAAPNIATEQARFDPRDNSAFRLAEALGKAQPVIDQFNEDWERKKMQEQLLKEGFYKQQFMNDKDGGAVTAAQVGERFPETVPIVRARVAEGVGQERGKEAVQSLINDINNNADLITDSAKRSEYIKQKKAELLAQTAKNNPGNEFFISGFSNAVDRELNQWENGWQRKTNEYYKEVQSKDFSSKVVDALSSADPQKALTDLDAAWKSSSSLDNITRNQLVIDTVTKQAFASDDPSMLDKIPTRFLNAETRAAVAKTKLQIQEARMTTVRNAQTLQNYQREEQTRNAKIEMINQVAGGGEVNPALYRNNPDAFNFALSMKDAGVIPDAVSQANVQKVRTAILNGATTAGLDQNQTIDQVLANRNINPKDRAELVKEIPKLIEGTIAMNDDMVKSVYTTRIGPQLESLERSPNQKIASVVSGQNLRGNAVKLFDNEIRTRFSDYYEEHGKWPTGAAKRQIVDAAVDKSEAFIQQQIKIGGSVSGEAATPAKPAATPKANKPAPTQADIDFVKKNPQYRQKFIEQFGREP